MPDYGFGALAIGTGAQAGLQQLIKQRLLEREMALREQSQAQDVDYQNRALAQRGEEVRATRDATEQYRQDALDELRRQHDMTNTLSAAGRIPYEADLDPRSAQVYEGVGLPVMKATSREQLNSPVANEYLEPDQFKAGWNKPEPKASKLMTPEEFEQWKMQKETEARIGAKYRPPSSEAAGSWTDTGRTNAQGEAIYVNSKTLEQRAMPFGAKQSPGASQEADRKRLVVVDATNKTLNAIDELLDESGNLRPEVKSAIGGSRLSGVQYVPGTEAYNAQAAIDRLRARMVTDLMAELKSQSRTGATGFGQLNLQELKIMQDSAAKLDPGQGEKAFQKELQNIRRRLELILKDGPSQSGGRFEIVR